MAVRVTSLLALAIVAATILLPRHFFPRTEINNNNNNRETNEKKYDVMDMAVLYVTLGAGDCCRRDNTFAARGISQRRDLTCRDNTCRERSCRDLTCARQN